MTSYEALQKVEFDRAAAREASEACGAAAQLLDAQLDARASVAGTARDGWSGIARTDFDTISGPLTDEGSDLHARVLAAAAAIDDAIAEADAEDRRRTEENERRREEHAAAIAAQQGEGPR